MLPARYLCACALMLACLATPLAVRAEGPVVGRVVRPDDRTVLRNQVLAELEQRQARVKILDEELREQAKRYDEMAAQRRELAQMTAAHEEAAKAAAAEKALKAKYAAAKAGNGKRANGRNGGGQKTKAGDAKPGGGGAAKDGNGGGAAAGGNGANGASEKKIDPLLVQHYLVVRLRDEARLLRARIAYLEGLLAKL